MKSAYIDYAMSVIISRALPDVRDGLKPVHRRVLYGMSDLGLMYNKPFKKSARIVGEVLGKYHPHGDASVYDTMVRMAQTWSLRYPLVDGQGNFGSIDGDSPAAMRYTEARLKRISDELLSDLNKDTIDFQPNFDESLKEPTVLPCKIPHLLVNGTSGIAVGMATNMPPHNLTEVVDGIIAYLDNNDITVEELIQHIPAPDFPTGGIIYGYQGVKKAMLTGRGRVVIRGVAEIETTKTGRERIVVTEIPYLVNKASLIEKTAHLVQEKKIEGISDIRDESDRTGMRIVYELKRDAVPMVTLNQLYKYTALQSSFGVNNVALVKGRPEILNLRDMIYHFVEHRHEVIYRRTQFELKEAKARQHILEGLLVALDNLDEVIKLIRASKDGETAKNSLIETFELSDIQAKAILDIRLQRLTAMERDKIVAEHKQITELIGELEAILADKNLRVDIIKEELTEMKERYGDARRTDIEHMADDLTDEDMIPVEEMVITISHAGYIKRTSLDEYRTQNRGGVGSRGTSKKDDDFTEHLFVASTHDYLLIFTNSGKVFWIKGYNIPEVAKTAKGRAIQNLLQMEKGDSIRAVINVKQLQDPDYNQNHYLVMCTEKGVIKKTRLEAFSRPRQNGIHAITINEDDQLLDVKLTNGENNIILAIRSGRAIHFHEDQVRSMGRTAAGVRGITLDGDDNKVVGMVCVARDDASLLVVSETGYGKRSSIEDYRITNRGGKGVITMQITEKTGRLVAIKEAVDTDDLILITKAGLAIRMSMSDMRVMGRATQGVRLIKLHDDDSIASVAKVDAESLLKDEEEENAEGEGGEVTAEAGNAENAPEANNESNEATPEADTDQGEDA
jgi:DNA gyrase subunit A